MIHHILTYIKNKGSLRQGSIPTKPRSRSVPDVVDTKFANLASCEFAH